MRIPRVVFQSLLAGGVGGLLLLVLLLRLNPEAPPHPGGLVQAAAVWWVWGAATVGLSLAGIILGAGLWARGVRKWRWFFPQASALLFILAAVLSRVNADLHLVFLSGSGHRTLGQDAVVWFGMGLLILAAVRWVPALRGAKGRVVMVVVVTLLPPLRLVWQPVKVRLERSLVARPLGVPTRPVVVVGVEGLDLNFLLAHATADRFPNLRHLTTEGSMGALRPYRPFLKRSLWTTVATGAYPRAHGVESRWAWEVPSVLGRPVRLLPLTPVGSRWVLPSFLTRRMPPPPTRIPALWARLAAAGIPTRVLDWPGIWEDRWALNRGAEVPLPVLSEDFARSLASALAPFPQDREAIGTAVRRDTANLNAVTDGASPVADLWIHLGALGMTRRRLAPRGAGDTRERAVQELVLELFDAQIGRILDLAGPRSVIAVVSPYGLAQPDSWERLRRLLGGGSKWRRSARRCPDGVIVLLGPGVVPGRRLGRSEITDLAPTLCYLLGLPVAQYMDGRVILDAVNPNYLDATPLRVVD